MEAERIIKVAERKRFGVLDAKDCIHLNEKFNKQHSDGFVCGWNECQRLNKLALTTIIEEIRK